MSAVLEAPREIPKMHLLSVEIYDSMIQTGTLNENDNVELLNGAIIEKTPKGNRHAYFNDSIGDFLKEKLGSKAVVRNQNPISLDGFSKPEPDIVLCKPPRRQYLSKTPTPADILLIIEVSDTTLYFDRHEKAAAYARNGIEQYLIVNVENNTIEDYRKPGADGYQSKQTYEIGEQISFIHFPELECAVADFLQN